MVSGLQDRTGQDRLKELGLYNVGREETSGRHGADLQNSGWERIW